MKEYGNIMTVESDQRELDANLRASAEETVRRNLIRFKSQNPELDVDKCEFMFDRVFEAEDGLFVHLFGWRAWATAAS